MLGIYIIECIVILCINLHVFTGLNYIITELSFDLSKSLCTLSHLYFLSHAG